MYNPTRNKKKYKILINLTRRFLINVKRRLDKHKELMKGRFHQLENSELKVSGNSTYVLYISLGNRQNIQRLWKGQTLKRKMERVQK